MPQLILLERTWRYMAHNLVKTSKVGGRNINIVFPRLSPFPRHTHTHPKELFSQAHNLCSRPFLLQMCQKLLDLTASSDSCWHSRLACNPLPTNQNRTWHKPFWHSLLFYHTKPTSYSSSHPLLFQFLTKKEEMQLGNGFQLLVLIRIASWAI